jgi:hypothetical protein
MTLIKYIAETKTSRNTTILNIYAHIMCRTGFFDLWRAGINFENCIFFSRIFAGRASYCIAPAPSIFIPDLVRDNIIRQISSFLRRKCVLFKIITTHSQMTHHEATYNDSLIISKFYLHFQSVPFRIHYTVKKVRVFPSPAACRDGTYQALPGRE